MSFLRSTILRKPSRVEDADVAGAEVAVGGEGGGVGLAASASSRCITCGPLAQISPASPIGDFAAVVVEQLDVGRGQRQADGAGEGRAGAGLRVRIGEVSERP